MKTGKEPNECPRKKKHRKEKVTKQKTQGTIFGSVKGGPVRPDAILELSLLEETTRKNSNLGLRTFTNKLEGTTWSVVFQGGGRLDAQA